MALDRLIDSVQLDADLTSVADAIREKGETSAHLQFPDGFVEAIQELPAGDVPKGTKTINITENGTYTENVTNFATAEINVNVPSGPAPTLITKTITENGTYAASSDNVDGYSSVTVNVAASGYSADDWLDLTKPVGVVQSNIAFGPYSAPYILYGRNNITKLVLPKATALAESFARGCSSIAEVVGDKINTLMNYALYGTAIVYAVFPALGTVRQQTFANCKSLLAADFGGTPGSGFPQGDGFSGCTNFNVLVLRASAVWPLSHINVFSGTPFASGKAGGTLYVPQALIANYQSATNWSTILGYTNNQILPIEGSIYETQYVDGTPIPTT